MLPLEILFHRLQQAGFALDTARKLRLLRALEQHAADDFPALKYRLAPLVARSGAEQQQFYELFDAFVAECGAEAERVNTVDGPETIGENGGPSAAPMAADPLWRRFWWVLPLLLFLTAVPWLVQKLRTPARLAQVAMDKNVPGIVREDSILSVLNLSTGLPNAAFTWEVRDASSGALEFIDSTQHLRWRARGVGRDKWIVLRGNPYRFGPGAGYNKENRLTALAASAAGADSMRVHVHCADPPKFISAQVPKAAVVRNAPARLEVFGIEKDAGALWIINGRDSVTGAAVTYRFPDEGIIPVTLRVYRDSMPADCYDERTYTVTVGTDKPYLASFALVTDRPRLVARLAAWVWGLLLLPLLPAGWFLRRWYRRRHARQPEKTRAALEAEYPVHDAAPYFVPDRAQEEKIGMPRDFFRLSDVLRRRELHARRFFDAPASVRATVEAGGYPAWRDAAQTRPAEYLFLVERSTERDPLGLLFARVTEFLKKRDVPGEVFFHDGRFATFFHADHPRGLSLQALHRLYPQYRLVLLGTGHGLVNAYAAGRPALLATPLAALLRWPRRLALTPEPPAAWSFQEALLHRHFLVFPADTDGLLRGFDTLDRLEEYEPGEFERWQNNQLRHSTDPNPRYRRWETPESHREYFSAPGPAASGQPSNPPALQPSNPPTLQPSSNLYRWLRALAVLEQPDFALTVAIGRALGLDVTHDALLALFRVPWLRAGAPDTALRLAFLRELPDDDERLARAAVAEELEAVRESVAGSFAATEWTGNLAVQRFALDPRAEEHRELIRDLRRLGLLSGGQLAELDAVVEKRLAGTPGLASPTLDAWLDRPAPRPWWTRDLAVGTLLLLASVLGLAMAVRYDAGRNNRPVESGARPAVWQRTAPLIDSALALNNGAMALWQSVDTITDYSRWLARRDAADRAHELLERADELRPPAGYPLADSNRLALHFDLAAHQLRFFLDGAAGPERLQLARQGFGITREQAAEFFGLPNRWRLPALHGEGLCAFYHGDTVGAVQAYRDLLAGSDSLFFDTVGMAVHLRTLLDGAGWLPRGAAEPRPWLRAVVLDARTGAPVRGARVRPQNGPALTTDARGLAALQLARNEKLRRAPATAAAAGYVDWRGTLTLWSTARAADTIRLLDGRAGFTVEEPKKKATAPDADGDGVADDHDNCPELAGPVDNGGCPPPELTLPLPEMVRVPGGTLMLGCTPEQGDDDCYDDEKPPHPVTLSDFSIGKYEVTNEQFAAFLNDKRTNEEEGGVEWINLEGAAGGEKCRISSTRAGYAVEKGYERHPVIYVSWYGARAYCQWLSEKTGRRYRLPTEAEWEYAARGGPRAPATKYAGSDRLEEVGWFYGNSGRRVHAGGELKANALGLYDMSGNVFEWCADWYGKRYYDDIAKGMPNPTGPKEGWYRMARGGSWNYSTTVDCRVSSRGTSDPMNRNNDAGFRVAQD